MCTSFYIYTFFSFFFFLMIRRPPRSTPFPTRRSSDLWQVALHQYIQGDDIVVPPESYFAMGDNRDVSLDRKSTRLNSSHVAISYAVFCLKKKKKNTNVHNKIIKQTIK